MALVNSILSKVVEDYINEFDIDTIAPGVNIAGVTEGAVYGAQIILRNPLPPEEQASETNWFA